ncbi:MAG: HK97 family phage prohead protease, partial [Sphingobium sp.]
MTKPTPAPQDPAEVPSRTSSEQTDDGKARRREKPRNATEIDQMRTGIMTRNTPPADVIDPEERRQPQVGGRGVRDLSLRASSYNADARTVEAVLSAGTAVRRYGFTEELEISAEAIDLSRVAAGICPLLDSHNQYQLDAVIGRILSVRIEDGQLIGVIEFADTPAGRDIEARVKRGEISAISIGYKVTRWQLTATDDTDHDTWRAVAWELLEASFVSVPADPNAVVRSEPGQSPHGNSNEEEDMRRNLPGGAAAAAPAPIPAPAAATTVVVEPNGGTRTEPHTPAGATAAPVQAPAADTVRAPTIPASRIIELCGRADELSAIQFDLIRDSEAGTLTETALQQRIADHLISARARPTVNVTVGRTLVDDDGYRNAIADALILVSNSGARAADFGIDEQRTEAAREFRGLT